MTTSDSRPATFDATFRYIKLGKDPKFRQHLREIGWQNGQYIVMAEESEPVTAVLMRVFENTDGTPAMIAMEMESEPFGFGLMFVEPVKHTLWRRRPPAIKVGPGATMGMLFAALGKCGEYVPNDWVKPVLFEKART